MSGRTSRRRLLQSTGVALGLLAAGEVGSRNSGDDAPESGPQNATRDGSRVNRSTGATDKWLDIAESGERVSIDHEDILPPSTTMASSEAMTTTASETDPGTPTATPTATATPTPTTTRNRYIMLAGTRYASPVYEIDAPRSGPTTMVVGGMHGDERAGYLAAEHVAKWGLDRGRLVVVPHANVPAIRRHRRYGSHGDLNRAFPTTTAEPTTRLARGLWAVLRDQDPDQLIDLHSSRGIFDGDDDGVGQAVFPTDIRPAPRYAADTVRAINDSLGLEGELSYRRGNLLDGDRPMLVHRFGEVLERPGFIAETYEGTPMNHQVSWHLFVVDYLLALFGQDAIIR